MKLRYTILIFVAAFLVQSTLLNEVSLFGVTPNLILCIVVLLSFWFDHYGVMGCGIFFGLLQDLCFGELIGIAALCYFFISACIWLTKHLFYKDNIFSVFFITLLSTVAYEFIYWGIHTIMGGSAQVVYMLSILPLLLIYNCAVTIVAYLIFGRKMVRHPRDRFF